MPLAIKQKTSCRYVLTPKQHATIDAVARTLPPDRKHRFELTVARVLQMSRTHIGFVTDELIQRAITVGLEEAEQMKRAPLIGTEHVEWLR
jgi:hypothetical protein